MGIKNISPILADVKSRQKNRRPSPFSNFNLAIRSYFLRIPGKIFTRSAFAFIVLAGITYAYGLITLTSDTRHALTLISGEQQHLKTAIPQLNTASAVRSLEIIHREIRSLYESADRYGIFLLGKLIAPLMPGIGPFAQNADYATILTETTLGLSRDLDYLKNDGFRAMMNKEGRLIIKALQRITTNLTILTNISAQIKNMDVSSVQASGQLATALTAFEKNYVPLSMNLYRTQELLAGLTSFLAQPNDQHILLIFQNPTEIRPSGGFIGSYGDITLNQGNIIDIRIDDIYNADRQLRHSFVPPKELQSVTRDWGARDANWFFDFPTSAQKVMTILEDSDLHYQRLIEFQGAIAINTNVLETIIKIIGPISLPDYNLTLDENNFLAQLQYEVEAGKDKKPGQNPKRILSVLTPMLLERLHELDENQKTELLAGMQNHLAKKDIMVYMKNKKIQGFLDDMGIAGRVSDLPDNFSGDYLAVVNANIAGGKSDAFVRQQIILSSSINSAGVVTDDLAITRSHRGQEQKEWWYRATNKDYLKILTPPGSKPISVFGNNPYRLSFNEYRESEYIYDKTLKTIEASANLIEKFQIKSGEESGKTYFGMWLHTPPGTTKEIKMKYELPNPVPPKEGQTYAFIFDKQSGVESRLEYTLLAPSGYLWAETNSELFSYASDDLPSRLTLTLTLKKNEL